MGNVKRSESDEADRVRALQALDVLDSTAEQCYDDLTALAAGICEVPIALISFVDSNRQWFKSNIGFPACETERDQSFCTLTIQGDDPFVVPDAKQDIRVSQLACVNSENGIRSYAGVPIKTSDGFRVGTICILDTVPRQFSQRHLDSLKAVGRQIERLLNQSSLVANLERTKNELENAHTIIEESSRAKAEFFANMSHEIRTPMNGIIGMTELALLDEKDSTQISRLQVIQSSGRTLLALVNDILDFSKFEAGKLELEDGVFSIRQASTEIIRLLEYLAYKKRLPLTLQVDANVPSFVTGDCTRFKQILSNLICNAVKFTESGSVRVNISAVFQGDEKVQLTVSVEDTGIGIAPEGLTKLFRSFTQADTSTTRRYGGTGLGLAISKALIEAMGGAITVESKLGAGSKFSFSVSTEIAAAPRGLVISENPSEGSFAEQYPRKVLVAEDNLINQKVIGSFLRKLGYAPVIVSDGAEAVEAVKNSRFDVVLMDCHMPVLDGFEATSAIRSIPRDGDGLKIFALSASAMREDQQRCYAVGMDDFLPKPISLEILKAAFTGGEAKFSPSCNLGALNLLNAEGDPRPNRAG